MPIRREERGRYPPDWKAISLRVREEAKWQCEWCGAKDKRIEPESNKVVLTVAHLNHRPEDNRRENLRALCQKCHNRYDAPMRAAGRRKRRLAAAGQQQLDLYADEGDAANGGR